MVGVYCHPLEPLHVNGNVKVDGTLYSGMPVEARGFRTPTAFGASPEYAETGNFIAFGDPGVSEDFIGYSNNTFRLLDSPEGGDTEDPSLFVGGGLEVAKNVRFTGLTEGAGTDLVIDANGNIRPLGSDVRLKKEFTELTDPLSRVLQLRAYSFKWKDDTNGSRDVGFIAQEVEKVVPEVVYTNPNDGMMGINYSRIPALLVEAIKEQQRIIDEKDREIDELRSRLETIENVLGIASE
jgi:hypothetical protein